MAYFDKTPSELLELKPVSGGYSCLTKSADPRWALAGFRSRHQVNGPVPFEVSEPIQVVSAWDQETYSDFIASDDFYFVSTRLKALVEAAGVKDVEFFPAFIENFDKQKAKLREPVSGDDLTPGNAGGGVRHEDYWWMNIWALEDLIDRQASVGHWVDGGAPFIKKLLDGAPGVDVLERDRDGRFQIVLSKASIKPIFRIKGLPNTLFVSQEFCRALEESGIDVSVVAFKLNRGI